MKLFERKTKMERLLETIENQQMLKAAARHAIETAVTGATDADQGRRAGERFDALDLRSVGSPVKAAANPLRLGAGPIKKAGKPTLVAAAGVAGVTAASAAVSALRKRDEGTST